MFAATQRWRFYSQNIRAGKLVSKERTFLGLKSIKIPQKA